MVEIRVGRPDTSVMVEEPSAPRDWYPFDPYALPRSKGFVVDYFLEYRPMEVDDDDMDTDDTGDSSSEDMDDDSESEEDDNEDEY
jgi:RNA polymerase I-specific transcription initiation factor RRN3